MRVEIDRGLADSIIVEDTMGDRVMLTTDHGWTTLSEHEAAQLTNGLIRVLHHIAMTKEASRVDHD